MSRARVRIQARKVAQTRKNQGDPLDSITLSQFADRACTKKPEECRAYIRIRIGRTSARARVAASGIDVTNDPAGLASELEQRLPQLAGDKESPTAYLEAIVRGEQHPYESCIVKLSGYAVDLDGEEVDERSSTLESATAWLLARQGDALVRIAQQAAQRAEAAELRAADLVHQLAALQTEVELARVEDSGGDSMMRALEAASPILTAAAARMIGGPVAPASPNGANGPESTSEEEATPIGFEEVEAELVQLFSELAPEQRSQLLERLGE